MYTALSTLCSFVLCSGKATALAVFDSGLNDLRLPLMRPVSLNFTEQNTQASSPSIRRESVSFLVQRYFEWTGTIEQGTIEA
jgi:hypothetical protein